MTGRIKKIVEGKPFGFLLSGGKEYFFHAEQYQGFWEDLEVDFRDKYRVIEVEFDPDSGPKGLRANNVRRLDYPNTIT